MRGCVGYGWVWEVLVMVLCIMYGCWWYYYCFCCCCCCCWTTRYETLPPPWFMQHNNHLNMMNTNLHLHFLLATPPEREREASCITNSSIFHLRSQHHTKIAHESSCWPNINIKVIGQRTKRERFWCFDVTCTNMAVKMMLLLIERVHNNILWKRDNLRQNKR